MTSIDESVVEHAALEWFAELGYATLSGPALSPGEPGAERNSFSDVLLEGRLRAAFTRLNPGLSADALDEAYRRVLRISAVQLLDANREFHTLLVSGFAIEFVRPDGSIGFEQVKLIDFSDPNLNDWCVVHQLTVVEGNCKRRPDLLVFVNGLPLAIVELKNAVSGSATVWNAFHQLQTYRQELPALFQFNELMVISDGLDARLGTLTSNQERFLPWRTIDGESLASKSQTQLQVLIRGVFEPQRLLDLIRYFIVFEEEGETVAKKVAGYHQFHAVAEALRSTLAARSQGDRRVGVVWHTQGSGKSLTMAFYAGRVAVHPGMQNPTLVVLTDRNDLDEQLFGTFSRCSELLRQTPMQARDRTHLRQLLKVSSGGVVFTTIQKFMPETRGDTFPTLCERSNVVVIADEAHRSQYDFIDGFARHLRDALPSACFIGFTGTPIESTDKNTQAVFGDYISVYDIQRAVEDGATVPIYYESRLARLDLKEDERPHLDTAFDELTEGEEMEGRERLKTKWSALEAVVGADRRLQLIAQDLLDHFDARLEAMDGKAMVVCMSRRICVDLYNALIALRPDWHDTGDDAGSIKIVMTGSADDPTEWQPHIRTKQRREALARRFKDANDPFRLVIVRDMWLTGFDAPCMHTMYLDKPMQGHGLMQAIARVNRVFRDKPGGLVVDYLGLADSLRRALRTYTESGGKGGPALDQEQAAAVLITRYEICQGILHGFDWSAWTTGSAGARLSLLPAAQEHVLQQENGKARFLQAVLELSKAFALAVPHPEAIRIRDDVGFFQALRAAMAKTQDRDLTARGDVDHAIRQIVSRALVSDQVIDIFAAAGLKNPDISILSDAFLSDVGHLEHKNVAVELLRKLLNDEVKRREKQNIVQARSFAEMLENAVRRYQNRAITAAQVLEELLELARTVRESHKRGEDLGLTPDELAFYDALGVNDAAVQELGDATLRLIARDLVATVRNNVTIDWHVRESVRAKLRVVVKRLLRKYGYPPDKAETATQLVLEQAVVLSEGWG